MTSEASKAWGIFMVYVMVIAGMIMFGAWLSSPNGP